MIAEHSFFVNNSTYKFGITVNDKGRASINVALRKYLLQSGYWYIKYVPAIDGFVFSRGKEPGFTKLQIVAGPKIQGRDYQDIVAMYADGDFFKKMKCKRKSHFALSKEGNRFDIRREIETQISK